jgi:hypothetical protein
VGTPNHTNDGAKGCQFKGGGKYPGNIVQNRLRCQDRFAEIAMQYIIYINKKLLPQGQVQAHFLADTVINCLGGMVAHGGNNRVNRQYAADKKGNEQQPEKRDDHGSYYAQNAAAWPRKETGAFAPASSGWCHGRHLTVP